MIYANSAMLLLQLNVLLAQKIALLLLQLIILLLVSVMQVSLKKKFMATSNVLNVQLGVLLVRARLIVQLVLLQQHVKELINIVHAKLDTLKGEILNVKDAL